MKLRSSSCFYFIWCLITILSFTSKRHIFGFFYNSIFSFYWVSFLNTISNFSLCSRACKNTLELALLQELFSIQSRAGSGTSQNFHSKTFLHKFACNLFAFLIFLLIKLLYFFNDFFLLGLQSNMRFQIFMHIYCIAFVLLKIEPLQKKNGIKVSFYFSNIYLSLLHNCIIERHL